MNENLKVYLRLKNKTPHTPTTFYLDKEYIFDRVFRDNNLIAYNLIAKPHIDSFLFGFNVTLMAYGQTNSGKTYTIQGNKSDFGLLQRILFDIFDKKSENDSLSFSYVEIYNETVYDLLKNIDIHTKSPEIPFKEENLSDSEIKDNRQYFDYHTFSYDKSHFPIENNKNGKLNENHSSLIEKCDFGKEKKETIPLEKKIIIENLIDEKNNLNESDPFKTHESFQLKDKSKIQIEDLETDIEKSKNIHSLISQENKNKFYNDISCSVKISQKGLEEFSDQKIDKSQPETKKEIENNFKSKNEHCDEIFSIESSVFELPTLFTLDSKSNFDTSYYSIQNSYKRPKYNFSTTHNLNTYYGRSKYLRNVPDIQIRETPDLGIYLENATISNLDSFEGALKIFERASTTRKTSKGTKNEFSSRSHAIFTIYLKSNCVMKRRSKFNIIDLAGSEKISLLNQASKGKYYYEKNEDCSTSNCTKVAQTNFETFLTETCNINKSLLTLGSVIEKLSKSDSFINFRDSKLTYLLKDCLNGNSQILIVGTIDYKHEPKTIHKHYSENNMGGSLLFLNDQSFLDDKKYSFNNHKSPRVVKLHTGSIQNSKSFEMEDYSIAFRNVDPKKQVSTRYLSIGAANSPKSHGNLRKYEFMRNSTSNTEVKYVHKNHYETINTLNFLQKAAKIHIDPKINAQIEGNVEDLKEELKKIYTKYNLLKIERNMKSEMFPPTIQNVDYRYVQERLEKLKRISDQINNTVLRLQQIMIDNTIYNESLIYKKIEQLENVFGEVVTIRNNYIRETSLESENFNEKTSKYE